MHAPCAGFKACEEVASALTSVLPMLVNMKAFVFVTPEAMEKHSAAPQLFAHVLRSAPPLQTLQLRFGDMTGAQAELLGAGIADKHGASLRTLDISNNRLNSSVMAALLIALLAQPAGFTGLQALLLGTNSLGFDEESEHHTEGIKALIRMLTRTQSALCELNVSFNDLGEYAMRLLNAALQTLPNVRVLNISHNHPARVAGTGSAVCPAAQCPKGAKAAVQQTADTVSKMTQLQKLAMNTLLSPMNSFIEEEVAQKLQPFILPAVGNLTALQDLEIGGYDFTSKQLPALAVSLRPLISLTRLILGNPCYAPEDAKHIRAFIVGWSALIDTIAVFKQLQHLYISVPQGADAEQLGDSLGCLPKLHTLDLTRSSLVSSEDSKYAFGAAMARLQAVTGLDLTRCSIKDSTMRILAPYLLQMSSLRKITLYHNDVQVNQVGGLSSACNELTCKVVGTAEVGHKGGPKAA